jgi:hypothetical protein
MTREFQDALGRAWTINISCSSLKRIAAHAGFDVADISNGKALDIFSGNTTHLLDVLWPLVLADAEKRDIDADSFGDGLRGDCIATAVEALKSELLDFFPSARRRLVIRLLDRMSAIVEQANQRAEQEIDSVQLAMANGGTLPTSVPACSESTQIAGLSAN